MRFAAVAVGLLVLTACSSSSSQLDTATVSPSVVPATNASSAAPPTAPTAPTSTGPATSTSSSATTSTSAGASTTSSSAATTTSTAAASTAAGRPAPPSTIAALLALGRPIVLAHTGGEDEYPGSTLFAYGESAAAGVDMLDLNVMLTADGVLVVQHDDSVDRLTNGTGKVGEMSYASLSALDNAYWFTADGVGPGHPDEAYVYRGMRTGAKPPPPGDAPDDFAIPRFSDLVTRFPEMTLNVEIEGSGAPAAAAAAELAKELRDLDREDAAVVTSFDDATVDVFRTLAPNVEVTPGLGASAAWVLSGTPLPDGMRILQLPPRFGPTAVLTPASIAAAHGAGYAIWVWPNDRALENRVSYEQFLDDGIDGLNINVPTEGVAAVAGRLPTSS